MSRLSYLISGRFIIQSIQFNYPVDPIQQSVLKSEVRFHFRENLPSDLLNINPTLEIKTTNSRTFPPKLSTNNKGRPAGLPLLFQTAI